MSRLRRASFFSTSLQLGRTWVNDALPFLLSFLVLSAAKEADDGFFFQVSSPPLFLYLYHPMGVVRVIADYFSSVP